MLAHSQKEKCSTEDGSPERRGKAMKMAFHSRSSGFGTPLALLRGHGTRTNPMFIKGAGEGTVRKLGTSRAVP